MRLSNPPDCEQSGFFLPRFRNRARHYNGSAMIPRMLKALKPSHQVRLLLAPLSFVVLMAASAFAQSAADNEVTPQVQTLYAQAKAAQQRGDNAAAIEKYRAMLKLAPHLAPAYNNLGRLYFNEHDYAQAVQALKQGLELNPD